VQRFGYALQMEIDEMTHVVGDFDVSFFEGKAPRHIFSEFHASMSLQSEFSAAAQSDVK